MQHDYAICAGCSNCADRYNFRITGLRCLQVFVWEPEDRNKNDQESVLYFLVNKIFNHLVFIYNSFKILVLILILRFPSVVSSSLFMQFR